MYKVTDACIGCGACTGVCPEVFDLNADGLAENIIGEVPEELQDAAKEAAESCPVEAIVNE
ncbi:MAG: ferredoxin [Erysipelotrichales bacterium]|nr:ferredoxin [Erysipelotrichales bacterium]